MVGVEGTKVFGEWERRKESLRYLLNFKWQQCIHKVISKRFISVFHVDRNSAQSGYWGKRELGFQIRYEPSGILAQKI